MQIEIRSDGGGPVDRFELDNNHIRAVYRFMAKRGALQRTVNKASQGPWVTSDSVLEEIIRRLKGTAINVICEYTQWKSITGFDGATLCLVSTPPGGHNAETNANARLIAAALESFGLCEKIFMEGYGADPIIEQQLTDLIAKVRNQKG